MSRKTHISAPLSDCEHIWEEIGNDTALCFECGVRLSRRDWEQRRSERDGQEQGALEIAGASRCHGSVGETKTQGVIRRQND